jgi:hypothetical protein
MGYVHEADILMDLACLEEVLEGLGWPVVWGTGTAAAESVLTS